MFAARASNLAVRRGVPLLGAAFAGGLAYQSMTDAPKPVAPQGSSFSASWSADALPKKKTSDPASVKPPLALQDEFDVVVRGAHRRAGARAVCT